MNATNLDHGSYLEVAGICCDFLLNMQLKLYFLKSQNGDNNKLYICYIFTVCTMVKL